MNVRHELVKLKGFCHMQMNAEYPPIWDYFKSTKDVDAQWMKLVEEMMTLAKQYNLQINRGLYFDKATWTIL